MKAALLSFHNAYNYGAALQAYAFQEAVENLGVECEYINYVNEYRKASYNMGHEFKVAISNRNMKRAVRVLLGTPFMKARGRNFDKFYSRYLRKTSALYTSSSEAAVLNDEYDKFIVGSDQVWNPGNNGGDTAYLLDFVAEGKKKISYSSSFGLDAVPDGFREIYEEKLYDFNRLGVRENRGVEIVRELTGRDAQLVLDPVFLLEKSRWDEIRHADGQMDSRGDYVFFYTNRPAQVEEFTSTGYNLCGKKKHILSTHVKPSEFLSSDTKVTISMSPENFLNEIAGADFVVTASFHCLAFAIIFQKQFGVLLTGNYGKDERIVSLLKLLGLEDRVVSTSTKPEQLYEKIEYDKVNEKLESARSRSLEYLRCAVFDEPFDIDKPENKGKYHCEDTRCTGCSACASVCEFGAIEMRENEEGFKYPIRNTELCTDCGKCHKVCQVYNRKVENDLFVQKYYAVKNTSEIRQNSSSGGVFTAVSNIVLDDGGVIVAANMGEDFVVSHTVALDRYHRDKMRNTYYVQSELGDIFREVKQLAGTGRMVLFVGTPCQVEGLKLCFGEKPENLILCDLICHGVPSPNVFAEFIKFLRAKGRLEKFRFRDKKCGWSGYTVTAEINGKLVKNKLWLQSFNNLFSHNVINRSSCSSCMFTNYNRPGDITIGDFWGIERVKPEIRDKLGISLVMTNSEMGEKVFSKIKDIEVHKVNKAETVQNSLLKPSPVSPVRNNAFRILISGGYEQLARKYGEWNIRGFIKNIVRKIVFSK